MERERDLLLRLFLLLLLLFLLLANLAKNVEDINVIVPTLIKKHLQPPPFSEINRRSSREAFSPFIVDSIRRKMDFVGESITNHTNVSMIIAKHLFSKEEFKQKNIVFSPLSLQIVLSIIAAGSEGPTQQQLLSFLQSNSTDDLKSLCSHLISFVLSNASSTGGPLLSVANGVWIEQSLSLQPSFKDIVATDFKATLASVDFLTKALQMSEEVNLWVEKETNGLIKNLLPPKSVHMLTKLIFANALYFKGAWKQKFNTSKTKTYDFHLLNGNSVKVPFMTSKKKQYIRAFDGFKVLGLPYEQGEDKRQFSMYLFLPNTKDGFSALVEKVASKSELLTHKLPLEQVEVGDFRIPRFNISFGLETSDMLKEVGVVLPFFPGGLTKMVDSHTGQNLFVSNIFQKSFVEVNEEGTEASAATGALITNSIPTRLDFVADHPFLFLIREDSTGTILFVGQVLNPIVG